MRLRRRFRLSSRQGERERLGVAPGAQRVAGGDVLAERDRDRRSPPSAVAGASALPDRLRNRRGVVSALVDIRGLNRLRLLEKLPRAGVAIAQSSHGGPVSPGRRCRRSSASSSPAAPSSRRAAPPPWAPSVVFRSCFASIPGSVLRITAAGIGHRQPRRFDPSDTRANAKAGRSLSVEVCPASRHKRIRRTAGPSGVACIGDGCAGGR